MDLLFSFRPTLFASIHIAHILDNIKQEKLPFLLPSFCHSRFSLAQKSGVSIIILQKSPQEIKRFLADIRGMDRQDVIQRHIQKVYAEECFRIADHYSTDEKLLYSFSSVENMIPASLIQSSDCRKIVINNTHEITLRLYQFRSCDRKHYEDILIEPFYPGSKATIYDIYLILAKSSFRESCSGKLLSYRIRYDIRKKFSFRWHVLFGDTPLPLESFDRFLNTLHALNSRQLLALFGTSITFCQEISPRFRKR